MARPRLRPGDTTIFRDPGESSSLPKIPAKRPVAGRAVRAVSLRIPAGPGGIGPRGAVEVLNAHPSSWPGPFGIRTARTAAEPWARPHASPDADR